jgi:esterase/lipase superfamily enzyme
LIFITDRNDSKNADWQVRFGSTLLADWSLSCGVIYVAAAPAREFGQGYDANQIVLPEDQQRSGSDDCLKLIVDEARKSSKKKILIATHGYNNNFADAVSKAKGVGDDIEYDGIVVVWAWPSEGRGGFYFQDEAAAAWSGPHFTDFFQKLLSISDFKFDLFAHSMGNHILLSFVQTVTGRRGSDFAKSYVFAAPDVDQSEFRQRLRTTSGQFFTLYACTNDYLLRVSAYLHSTNGIRAGTGGDNLLLMNGLQSIIQM